jgi:WD40 repeat protein
MAAIDPTKTHQLLEYKHGRPLLAVRWSPGGNAVYFSSENAAPQRFVAGAEGAEPTVSPLEGGHDSWVKSMAVLPDDRTVVTAGYDGRLVWFDVAGQTPALVRVVEAHDGWARSVAASPDGRMLATCGNDTLVRLWDATDGRELAVLSGHESHVYEVAWRPDGTALVSCDLKGVIKEWDPAAGTLRRDIVTAEALWKYDTTFRADIGGARSIAFNSDGSQLAIGGITKVTNAFAGIGKPVIVVVDWEQPPLAAEKEPIASEPDAEPAEKAAESTGVRQLLGKGAGDGVCWGVAWHPEGFWIGQAGGGGGGWLRFFKPDASEDFHALKLPANGRGMALSPDATQVAVAMANGDLKVYRLHE